MPVQIAQMLKASPHIRNILKQRLHFTLPKQWRLCNAQYMAGKRRDTRLSALPLTGAPRTSKMIRIRHTSPPALCPTDDQPVLEVSNPFVKKCFVVTGQKHRQEERVDGVRCDAGSSDLAENEALLHIAEAQQQGEYPGPDYTWYCGREIEFVEQGSEGFDREGDGKLQLFF
ncbi:hypothetical protein B0T14DRAFT_563693 [Immersiella caudata]|uniref:Uncharacterized protein n=1 Tax=Immersiella caudata TaxID=314043 RepID=A0AA39X5Z4_9PEZI|nr:hypothetical protein B0T14DRAFT_563693 [Immersiella caudata]